MKSSKTTAGIYISEVFGADVLTAYSGREFPNAKHEEFLDLLGIPQDNYCYLKQVHSANIIHVKSDHKPHDNCQADGMITAEPGLSLGIRTADCVPIFFWEPEKRVIAIAHAGWRGVLHGIASKITQALRHNFLCKSESIRVFFGPSIRKCCYEVGEEFNEFFPEFYLRQRNGKAVPRGFMDLTGALKTELTSEGIPAENVTDSGICTACSFDQFYSARRGRGAPERILSVIQIQA